MSSAERPSQGKKSSIGLICNIDRRGQRARAAVGIVLLVASAISFVLATRSDAGASTVAIIVGISLACGGIFCLFEAANGWCAVRAMGYKTKL